MNEEKISKVAICPECGNFASACHVDYVDRKKNNEFMKLSDQGYTIKIEAGQETRNREYGCDCLNK